MGQTKNAMLSTGLMLLFLIVVQYVTMRHPKYSNVCRVLLVVGMNMILYPIHFFTSGGIHSGMITFYLNGLVLIPMMFNGKRSIAAYLVSLVGMEASIILTAVLPQYVQPMTEQQHMGDMMITLVLSSVTLFSIFTLIMIAYDQERRNNRQLMEKLREMSVLDALSGLYNRRELFRRLEVMYGGDHRERTETLTRSGHYIAMFDVDGFKKLNDTYGHGFGDEVLVSVSRVLHDMARPEAGELCARYGGEEFVSILRAGSMEEAYARIDRMLQQVSALRWPGHPSVSVSISGGLIACEDHPDLTRAMHDVDELLYKAKAEGKNRICCAE